MGQLAMSVHGNLVWQSQSLALFGGALQISLTNCFGFESRESRWRTHDGECDQATSLKSHYAVPLKPICPAEKEIWKQRSGRVFV